MVSNYSFNSKDSGIGLENGRKRNTIWMKIFFWNTTDEMICPAWIIYMNKFFSNSRYTPLKKYFYQNNHAWMMTNNSKYW